MSKLIFIAAGGAVGALMRYGVSGLPYKYWDTTFPWGTMSVNLIGCFIIGMLWHLFEVEILPRGFRPFVLIGMLGAFTTFSTFGLESLNLLRDGQTKMAIINIMLSNIGGIGLVFSGMKFSRFVLGLIK